LIRGINAWFDVRIKKTTDGIGRGIMREFCDGPPYDGALVSYFRAICISF